VTARGPFLREVEQFTKPGTANVTPADRKKLAPLLRHYGKMAHPFTVCVRDQRKHGLSPGHANRRCAVLKDLIRGTTKWRNREAVEEAVLEGWERLEELSEEFGAAAVSSAALGDVAEELEPVREDIEEAALRLSELGPVLNESLIRGPRREFRAFRPIRQAGRAENLKAKRQSDPDFEKKHPRDPGGTGGGEFITKGPVSSLAKPVARKLGVAGQGTFGKKDVRRFQRREGLAVDGKIGAQTASALLGRKPRAPGALPSLMRKRLGGKLQEDNLVILGASPEMEDERMQEGLTRVSGYTYRQDGNTIHVESYTQLRNVMKELTSDSPIKKAILPKGTVVKKSKGGKLTVSKPGERSVTMGARPAADAARRAEEGRSVANPFRRKSDPTAGQPQDLSKNQREVRRLSRQLKAEQGRAQRTRDSLDFQRQHPDPEEPELRRKQRIKDTEEQLRKSEEKLAKLESQADASLPKRPPTRSPRPGSRRRAATPPEPAALLSPGIARGGSESGGGRSRGRPPPLRTAPPATAPRRRASGRQGWASRGTESPVIPGTWQPRKQVGITAAAPRTWRPEPTR